MTRLEEKYINTVKPSLMKEFSYTSPMEAPKLVKIVINMGVGDAIANPKALEEAVEARHKAELEMYGEYNNKDRDALYEMLMKCQT